MNTTAYLALMDLEWKRTQFLIISFVSFLMIITLADRMNFAMDVLGYFIVIFPYFPAAILAAGVMSDDHQQKTSFWVLSLPVSRHAVWGTRNGFRLFFFVCLLSAWSAMLGVSFERWKRFTSSDQLKISLSAIVLFALASYLSNVIHNTFETAIGSMISFLVISILIGMKSFHLGFEILYLLIAAFFLFQSYHLFAAKDQMEWKMHWPRMLISTLVFSGLLICLDELISL